MTNKMNIIRHFSYCDVEGINSVYSQMFSNTQEITITDKKSNGFSFSGTVGLPYILQGFLATNTTGEYSRDWDTEQSSRVTISIEDKVRSILGIIKNDGLIDDWSDNQCLVSGYATIIDYESFVNRVNRIFKSDRIKYTDFEAFIKDVHKDPHFEDIWKKFTKFAEKQDVFCNYGSLMKLNRDFGRTGVVMKSIAVDLRYPVILHYSAEKLLVSNSNNENTNLINSLPMTGILGILSKATTNLYVLKPLAMWHDLSYTSHARFIDRATKEKEQRISALKSRK